MPRWIAIHRDGRQASIDADLVDAVGPADSDDVNQGSLLRFRSGEIVHVDEAVHVVELLLERMVDDRGAGLAHG